MGGSQSSQAQNILLLGLDGAGKTSILARLVGDEVRTVLPTLGFSVRTFTLGSSSQQLKLWDLGGRASVRHYWPAYYGKAQAIAFVIDTSDHHKLAENSAVLQHLLDDEDLIGLPLLVFANKQDAGNAIPASEARTQSSMHVANRARNAIALRPVPLLSLIQHTACGRCAQIEELMHLGSIRDRLWHCTSCSALRGTGIVDGLHWCVCPAAPLTAPCHNALASALR